MAKSKDKIVFILTNGHRIYSPMSLDDVVEQMFLDTPFITVPSVGTVRHPMKCNIVDFYKVW